MMRNFKVHRALITVCFTSALVAIVVMATCRREWTDGERYVVRLQKSYFAVRDAATALGTDHPDVTLEQALALCSPELLTDPVDGQSLSFNPEIRYWLEKMPWPGGELAVVAPRCADETSGPDCIVYAFSFDLQLVAIEKNELPAWARE